MIFFPLLLLLLFYSFFSWREHHFNVFYILCIVHNIPEYHVYHDIQLKHLQLERALGRAHTFAYHKIGH